MSPPAEHSATILVVDDEPSITVALSTSLRRIGYTCVTASSGQEALKRLSIDRPDLVISDVRMPGMTGFDVLRETKSRDADVQFVIMTAYSELEFAIEALRHDADDYLLKPFDLTDLRHTVARALEHRRLLLESRAFREALSGPGDASRGEVCLDALTALATAVETRDGYDAGHVKRLVDSSMHLGRQLGLSDRHLRGLRLGAILHDVGKLAVPESILSRSGTLSDEDRERLRGHSVAGESILRHLPLAGAALAIVRHHHERWDGSGYPDALAGEDIPLGARIVAVADAFEAMTHDRPYRRQRTRAAAVAEIRQAAAAQFDPRVAEAFLQVVDRQS